MLQSTQIKIKGFTLIELLVVISIISILSLIGLVSFQNIKTKVADAKMQADLDAIKNAYEVNYDPTINNGQGGYKALADSNFASGKIPTQPNGSPYPCSYGPDAGNNSIWYTCTSYQTQGYQVSAILSTGSISSSSNQGTYLANSSPNPSATPTTAILLTPPSSGTVVVSDNFNRVNSTSLGKADTGQSWIVSSGSFGISSNQAYPVNGCPAPGYAVVDSGISDGTIQVSLPVNTQDTRIPFRFIDNNNTYWIERQGGTPGSYSINKVVNGVRSGLKVSSIAPANGDTVKIVLNGSSINLYVNNTLAAFTNDSSLSGTKHGIGVWCTGTVRFDNFSVSTNPPAVAVNTNTQYNTGVLVLKYFPLTANGQNIDISVTGDVGGLYSTIRQLTTSVDTNLLSYLPKGTSYLLYSNPQAKSSLNYSVVDSKEYTQAVPFDPTTRRPLYTQILNGVNICDYVNNKGVNEVWLWAYQGPTYPGSIYPYLNISESKMSGPFGDISNSYRGNDMPLCAHTYRLYTFNYGRGTAEAMHSWGHQIEAEMSAVDSNLWSLFQGPHNGRNSNLTTRCGDVHSPPNAKSDYDYADSSSWNSDCLNWNPDNLGNLSAISCSNWGCSQISDGNNAQVNYLIWMYQNIPGMNNSKTYQGKSLRNWWDVHGDFDNVMENSRRLTVQ